MTWAELGKEMGWNAVLLAFVFGLLMALLVAWLRRLQFLPRRGALGLVGVVTVGVGGTVGCGTMVNFLTVEVTLWLVLMFLASGIPMLVEAGIAEHQSRIEEGLKDG